MISLAKLKETDYRNRDLLNFLRSCSYNFNFYRERNVNVDEDADVQSDDRR